jgi:CubicO group peptidase (beta-lactamase class C family)
LLALLGGLNPNLIADNSCNNLGCVSVSKFSASLYAQLQGKVVGYVAMVGDRTVEYGWARTDADPPNRKMSTDVPIYVASVSKALTAIAVLQSLGRHNLSIDSKIAPFLPPDWIRGPNIDTITFRQLLTHRAGFRDGSMSYEGLQQAVKQGVLIADQQKAIYNNLNFAIFRVLLPYMEDFSDPGPATRPEATANFYVNYMRQHVFQPVGVTDADCKPQPHSNPALYYPFPPGDTHGAPVGDSTLVCGGVGWVLSASDLFRVVESLIHDTKLLTKAQKRQMDEACLGWDCSVSRQGDFRGKNGIWYFGNGVSGQTFVGILKGKLGVVVLTNSQPPGNVSSVVLKAFQAASYSFH